MLLDDGQWKFCFTRLLSWTKSLFLQLLFYFWLSPIMISSWEFPLLVKLIQNDAMWIFILMPCLLVMKQLFYVIALQFVIILKNRREHFKLGKDTKLQGHCFGSPKGNFLKILRALLSLLQTKLFAPNAPPRFIRLCYLMSDLMFDSLVRRPEHFPWGCFPFEIA